MLNGLVGPQSCICSFYRWPLSIPHLCSFTKTITRWSPALSEIRSCLVLLLQGFGLETLPDFWSHYFPCWLWHALQKLQTPSPLASVQPAPVGGRTSQYHLARIRAGWFVGRESRGVPASPLNLHQQVHLSPPLPGIWDWQQTS